jgi:hypothetical protein
VTLCAHREDACGGCRRASCGVTLERCRLRRRYRRCHAAWPLHQGQPRCCSAADRPLQGWSRRAVHARGVVAAAAVALMAALRTPHDGQAPAGLPDPAVLLPLPRDCPHDGCCGYRGALQKACKLHEWCSSATGVLCRSTCRSLLCCTFTSGANSQQCSLALPGCRQVSLRQGPAPEPSRLRLMREPLSACTVARHTSSSGTLSSAWQQTCSNSDACCLHA